MKKLFSKELLIGLCVLSAIGILIFGVNYLKGVNLLSPANYYYVSYENVDGLTISAPVTIDGFKVGQVRDIEFDYDNPGKIKVMIAVDRKLRVPQDSRASIGSTLMNGAYVNLTLGRSSEMLGVGSIIPSVKSGDLMSTVSNEMVPAVSAIIPKIDTLLTSLNQLVENPALATSINRLDGITLHAEQALAGIDRSMNRELPMLMGNARRITTNLDSMSNNLGQLSYQLKTLPLNATVDNVNELTSNLTQLSRQLNAQNTTLGKLTTDPELYNRLNSVAGSIDSLVMDIKKNPKRYINIKVF